jgi:hypothetical protein
VYKVTLETTDVSDSEYQRYLSNNDITAKKIAEPANIAGAGEIVEYTAANPAKLVALVYDYFDSGDDEVTEELVKSIKNTR